MIGVDVTFDANRDAEQILEDRARELAVIPEERQTLSELHLVLRLGVHRVGVPAARARHVSRPRPLTAVPAAPEVIVGTTSVLGALVTVVDLAALLDAPADHPHDECNLVVIDGGEESFGLLVDEVEDLIDVDVTLVESGDHAVGQLAGALANGLRLLSVDALLADPRVSPSKPSSADSPRGET